MTVVDHVKLFRNRSDLKFDGRIHEQILPAIRAAGGDVAWTDLYVVHSGSDTTAVAQEKKRERDLRILERELTERPDHPFTLFNLGMTFVDGGRFAEAAEATCAGALLRSGPEESHLRKAFALLLYAEMRLDDRGRAQDTCRRAVELFPHDAELRFREGVLLHDLGRLEEARRAYLDVLENREERHFTSVDRAITGFKARQNLAVVAADLGDMADAEHQWRAVVREAPRYRTGWRGLGDILLRLGRLNDAHSLAEKLIRDDVLSVEGMLLKHRVALIQGRLQEARMQVTRATMEYPNNWRLYAASASFLRAWNP